MIENTLLIALRQLGRNRGRTALTSLGILIGVAAVICMVALGRGATTRVEDDLRAFGNDVFFVVPGNEGHGGRGAAAAFREADADALAALSSVQTVVPTAARAARATHGDRSWPTTAWGANDAYFPTMSWTFAEGRGFLPGELRSGADVCVAGATVVRELFGAQPALDGRIRLGKLECRVVGILGAKGHNTFGMDQDDLVVVPLRTLQRRVTGDRDVTMILVSPRPDWERAEVRADVEATLRVRRHLVAGADADFFVRDMAEALGQIDQVMGVLTAFLGAVAAISLLVGGIGIMNIMMVSVAERTREIGVRLAIGATAHDVQLQFLVEAVVLSWVGGVAGMALGVGLSWAVGRALDLPFVLDPEVVALAFAVAGTVGVVFGWFPARRAARMHPIDALRHE